MQKKPMTLRMKMSCLATTVALTGCMSWTPGWKPGPIVSPIAAKGSAASLADGDVLLDMAGDAQSLEDAIAAYEGLLVSSPADGSVLGRLAETHILYGAAYAKGTREKGRWYRAGIRYAERAMAGNEAFEARVASNRSIGDAVSALGRDEAEMRAMLLWITGVSYYFKECLGPRAVVYFRWMLRTREVMERMLELDPEFEHGAVLFSLGIYNLALPPGAGRDMERSEEFLQRAVSVSGTSLLPRWGRAKYFQVRTGNREGFLEDLEWVIAQNPREADSKFAWNVYFQRDAREMLSRVDALFATKKTRASRR
ncbi:MAG: TRAP transporter TatT component family protein [Thermoanaerobaculia bacterium]